MKEFAVLVKKAILNITVSYLLLCGLLFNCRLLPSAYKNIKDEIALKAAEKIVVDKDTRYSYEYKYLTTVKGGKLFDNLVLKRFYINDNGDDVFAKEVVFKFVLELLNRDKFTYDMSKKFLSKDDVWAYRYDLDNDGEQEILGFYKSWDFVEDGHFYLFILKKVDDKYIDVYRGNLPIDINSIVVFDDISDSHYKLGFVQWNKTFDMVLIDLIVWQES